MTQSSNMLHYAGYTKYVIVLILYMFMCTHCYNDSKTDNEIHDSLALILFTAFSITSRKMST